MDFSIERWSAFAPGLAEKDDWRQWLLNPTELSSELDPVGLKQFAPMIRRRFGKLGKCAMGAALDVVDENRQLPCIFASRHGNAELTLDLLNGIASSEDMSPTGFSLAVHNAISGLYTIARKDNSPVTSIAAVESLILQTVIEASGQLQDYPSVLCVVYDLPLPEPVQSFSEYDFPFSVAFVLNRNGNGKQLDMSMQNEVDSFEPVGSELIRFISFLLGNSPVFESSVNGSHWRIELKGS